MKIVLCHTDIEGNACATGLYAHSALGRNHQPMFVPEGQWQLAFAPAVRISRLGLAIEPTFASRYRDAATVAAMLRPAPGNDCTPAMLAITDNAVVAGDWMPIIDLAQPLRVDRDGATPLTAAEIDNAISTLSLSGTWRTGDILIFESHASAPTDVVLSHKPVTTSLVGAPDTLLNVRTL